MTTIKVDLPIEIVTKIYAELKKGNRVKLPRVGFLFIKVAKSAKKTIYSKICFRKSKTLERFIKIKN